MLYMEELKSEGVCVFCNKTYTKAGMSRHLGTHLKTIQTENKTKGISYHVQVPAAEMFLHLLVKDKTKFEELDAFLRGIWLECCGHLSAFRVKGMHYDIDFDDYENTDFGEPMKKAVGKLFHKGMQLDYEYDFGSSTYLEIKVLNEYQISLPSNIVLLSRNEPLPILCHSCNKKPAIEICSICIYEGACMFCKSCAKKHVKSCGDFEDYSMPVVNSPRMGVCAYDGGTIDTKRDGAWKG